MTLCWVVFLVDFKNFRARFGQNSSTMDNNGYTNDAWIKFVTFDPVKWEFHQNVLLKDLIIQYLTNDFFDE